MNIKTAQKKLKENYPDTSTTELEIFADFVRDKKINLKEFIYDIIKNDTRDFKRSFPDYETYRDICKMIMDQEFVDDNNSLNWVLEKFKDLSIKDLISKCREIRENHKIRALKNWEVDFLHQWEALSNEESTAKDRMQDHELEAYLKQVKMSLEKGERPERIYMNNSTFLDFKRNCQIDSFENIKGKF